MVQLNNTIAKLMDDREDLIGQHKKDVDFQNGLICEFRSKSSKLQTSIDKSLEIIKEMKSLNYSIVGDDLEKSEKDIKQKISKANENIESLNSKN